MSKHLWQKIEGEKKFRMLDPGMLFRWKYSGLLFFFLVTQLMKPFLSLRNSHITSHSESQGHVPSMKPRNARYFLPQIPWKLGHGVHSGLSQACAPTKDLEDTHLENSFKAGSLPLVLPIVQVSFSKFLSYSLSHLIHFQFTPSLLLSTTVSSYCLLLRDLSETGRHMKGTAEAWPKSRGKYFLLFQHVSHQISKS